MKNMKNAMVNDVEVSKEEEKAMENQNVAAQENHEGLVRRFCVECGKEMWLPQGSRQSICNECKQKKAQQNAKRAKELASIRKERLGIVTMNISIYSTTKEILKKRSSEKGVSIADFLKEILEKDTDPAKQEEIA